MGCVAQTAQAIGPRRALPHTCQGFQPLGYCAGVEKLQVRQCLQRSVLPVLNREIWTPKGCYRHSPSGFQAPCHRSTRSGGMTPTQAMSQRLLLPKLLLESPHHFAVQSLTRRSTGLPFYVGHVGWESFSVLPDRKFQNSSFHGKCFTASTCSKFKHKLLQRW